MALWIPAKTLSEKLLKTLQMIGNDTEVPLPFRSYDWIHRAMMPYEKFTEEAEVHHSKNQIVGSYPLVIEEFAIEHGTVEIVGGFPAIK